MLYGGKYLRNDLYISPTMIDQVSPEEPLMQEEIFGPLLPLIEYDNIDEAIAFVNRSRGAGAFIAFRKQDDSGQSAAGNVFWRRLHQ